VAVAPPEALVLMRNVVLDPPLLQTRMVLITVLVLAGTVYSVVSVVALGAC
jgi:hypothetical protein